MLGGLDFGRFRSLLRFSGLRVRMGGVGFDFEEDMTDLASLIFFVMQFLYDSLFGSSDFCELFVRFDIS